MAYIPIKVPVLPRPALQCTDIAPELGVEKCLSHIFKKSSTISSDGLEPSTKNRSVCDTPCLMNLVLSYLASLSLMTFLMFQDLKTSEYSSGVKPDL